MIILLSGSINSGKSTVAKRLAAKFNRPAIIEGDSLRAFIESLPLEEAIPITLENIIAVVRNLTKQGFTCIVPYPLSQDDHRFITENLVEFGNIFTFVLSPKIEKVLANNLDRTLNEWEKTRIQQQYSMGIATPPFGHILDNTNDPPDETAEKIYKIIQNHSSSNGHT